MLKIAEKTYTSIPALLFRLDQGRDILVEPKLSTKGGLNKHIKKEHSDDTKDTEIIVKQEFSEFKEEPIGIYREYSDYENFISVNEIKPEPI